MDCNPSYQCPVDFKTCNTALTFKSRHDPALSGNVVYTMSVLQTLNKAQIREILVDMLRREDELRLCNPAQAEFGRIGERHEDFNSFVTALQAHVSLEFQVDPAIGVELIRSAVSLYPDDDEIKSIPHYVRNNRCKAGFLKAGDTPPDCAVTDLDGNPQQLVDILAKDRPVVLLGASHT